MAERTEPGSLVLVASGLAGLRKRWRQSLERHFIVHEVTERSSLERTLTTRRAAALLLDLDLPELGGIRGVAALQRLRPATRIVLVTSHPDEQEGIAALKAGVRGYCDRDIEPRLLGKALDVVQKGEIWVGRKLIPHLLEELTALTEQQELIRKEVAALARTFSLDYWLEKDRKAEYPTEFVKAFADIYDGALGQDRLLESLADRRLLARVIAPFVEVETVAKDVDLELDLLGECLRERQRLVSGLRTVRRPDDGLEHVVPPFG